ncbi:MAG: hypothetical protein ACE5NG_06310, partial [bacterium]
MNVILRLTSSLKEKRTVFRILFVIICIGVHLTLIYVSIIHIGDLEVCRGATFWEVVSMISFFVLSLPVGLPLMII